MQFVCEDLPAVGVRLIPHDSPNFAPLLADITRHIESPPSGGPPPLPDDPAVLPDPDDPASALLWNQSGKPICAYTLIWDPGGRFTLGVGSFPTLLLPFGLPEERRAFEAYWHTILPNSKRWVNSQTELGSNADLRPPAPDEVWKGGVMRWGSSAYARPRRQPDTVRLSLDAVFFATGECAGPDTKQLWEQIVFPAEVAQQVAAAARSGIHAGLSADRILAAVEQVTGTATRQPPDPPNPFDRADPHEYYEHARWELANWIAHMRKSGDEPTVATLNSWADARVPQFRRI